MALVKKTKKKRKVKGACNTLNRGAQVMDTIISVISTSLPDIYH
jgi:hypothetical protein